MRHRNLPDVFPDVFVVEKASRPVSGLARYAIPPSRALFCAVADLERLSRLPLRGQYRIHTCFPNTWQRAGMITDPREGVPGAR